MLEDPKDIKIYRSCDQVINNQIYINDKITKENCYYIYPCSPAFPGAPYSKLEDNHIDSVNNFNKLRDDIINEHMETYYTDNNKARKCTWGCEYCNLYRIGDWSHKKDKITFVNLSIYPSPCQSKCIYCEYASNNFSLTYDIKVVYGKLFDFLGYLKNHDKLDNHIVWQISPGEITIHPYRNKLYKLVGDMTAIFFTNAFIFDKKIAIKIRNNQQSKVNVSLDSGTPSTWKKVKGVDNFDTVINNLMKYREYSEQDISEQIVLKYIILPGINTNMKDYFGFMKIMKLLRINCLQLSRNLNVAYQPSTKEHKILIDNVIKLASLAQSHGFKYYLYPGAFTQDDINNINDAVKQKTVDKAIYKNEK